MWNDEQYESDDLSIEAQVARNMGDDEKTRVPMFRNSRGMSQDSI